MVAAVMGALVAAPAAARTTGIVGYSGKSGGLFCSNAGFGCHAMPPGTMPPLVRFDGPTQVAPDSETTYTFVVSSQMTADQTHAGFNVAASGGTLMAVAGQGSSVSGGEISHTGPKDNDENGDASWQFIWKAPSAPGEYVLFGAGNSVNFDFTVDGDQAAITTLMITVGEVSVGCAGDCDGDGTVAINELISGVNIALGTAPVSTCEACDANEDGMVSISELIGAVNNALAGCP
jgi:hypothetical protein